MSTNYDGTETFIINLYRNIDRNKVQFDFLNVYDSPIACEEEIKSLGGNIYHLHLRRRQDGLKKYKKQIREFYGTHYFDIVHQNVQDLINIDMIKYAKKYGIKKRIIHAHNSEYGQRNKFFTRISIFINKISYKKYANILLSCSKTSNDFVFGKKSKSIFVINGIETNKFCFSNDKRNQIRKQYQIVDSDKAYCHVARIDYQKNQFFLLDVFSNLLKKDSNSLLLFCGSGSKQDEEELLHYCNSLNIKNRVYFLGKVANIQDILCGSDYFILPSRFEGFPISLVEAETSGLPCIISDKVPTDIIVVPLVHKIPLDLGPVEFAKKVFSIKQNFNRYECFSESKCKFDITNTVKQVEELYL